jgi:hypothetical protein
MTKNLLSAAAIISFVFIGVASTVNKMHYGAFNYNNNVEEKSQDGNWLVKNDGTKIYGSKIDWQSGLILKDQIKIDNQKFQIDEIKGYRDGDKYYGRRGNQYIKRIVHGKANVYVQFTQVTSTSTDSQGRMRNRTYTRTDQYGQIGEDGKLVPLAGQKEIRELLSDCPLAVEMASLSNSEMRKALKRDANYLNSIFDVYNNNCKPVK